MSRPVTIELQPLGKTLEIESGAPLADALFAHGVEFPCGGRGRCRRCRIRVVAGTLEATAEEREILSAHEIAEGWRLACRCRVEGPAVLDIAQWETPVLSDDSRFEFEPGEGLGVAVDLGTTTLVAQLLDLRTARVLAVATALNPQAAHGADIMSRVQFGLEGEGRKRLRELIREAVGGLIEEVLGTGQSPVRSPEGRPTRIAIVGNTVMHHLFCGLDVEPLAHVPFESPALGLQTFRAEELGWDFAGGAAVLFLPCLGGFVGSDILAGILATRLNESDDLQCLIDLGTNGEIVLGSRARLLCASTAAGPAFEGGRIGGGMRAATGAISECHVEDGCLRCHVIGGTEPRGICGSGLVDAVTAGLELGALNPSGRLAAGRSWEVCPPVALTQRDIRELQLAKGAIAAGIRILAERLGARLADVRRVYLAGAFGNYVNRTSARRIGLLPFSEDQIEPAGNTALLGAKLALFAPDPEFAGVCAQVEHMGLASDAEFQNIYVEEMQFPETAE